MADITNKRIIYPDGEGGVAILVPTLECPSIERLAQDVPVGVSTYTVVDVSGISSDRSYRNAWTYEED